MFKKHMTPLTPRGQTVRHQGKGAESTNMPDRNQLASLAKPAGQSLNNYAKATPTAQPQPNPATTGIGLGSGGWSGNGM